MITERGCALILQTLPGIGAAALSKLHQQFGSFTKALHAPASSVAANYRKGLNAFRARPDDFKTQALEHCATGKPASWASSVAKDKEPEATRTSRRSWPGFGERSLNSESTMTF